MGNNAILIIDEEGLLTEGTSALKKATKEAEKKGLDIGVLGNPVLDKSFGDVHVLRENSSLESLRRSFAFFGINAFCLVTTSTKKVREAVGAGYNVILADVNARKADNLVQYVDAYVEQLASQKVVGVPQLASQKVVEVPQLVKRR